MKTIKCLWDGAQGVHKSGIECNKKGGSAAFNRKEKVTLQYKLGYGRWLLRDTTLCRHDKRCAGYFRRHDAW